MIRFSRTKVSGLIGIIIGGGLIAVQFVRTAGHPKPEEWAIPALILVVGVVYFLFGDRLGMKKKDP